MDRFAISHPPPSSPSSEKVEPVKSFPCLERYLEVNLGLTPATGQTSLVNCSDDSVIDLDVSDENINLDGIIFDIPKSDYENDADETSDAEDRDLFNASVLVSDDSIFDISLEPDEEDIEEAQVHDFGKTDDSDVVLEQEKPMHVLIEQSQPGTSCGRQRSPDFGQGDSKFSQEDFADYKLIFDNDNVFHNRRPTENKEFMSENPEENDDINDPGWEEVKNLRSDQERKQFAMNSFGNLEPGNPQVNLTFHGFRRRNKARMEGLLQDDIQSQIGDFRSNELQIKNGTISMVEESKDFYSKKRRASGDLAEAPEAKRRKIDYREYKDRLGSIIYKYKQKFLKPHDLRYTIKHWREGLSETVSFLQYYDENQNRNNIDPKEIEKYECLEMIYSQFVEQYGLNEIVLCKDCAHDERRDRVVHSY